MKKSKCKIFICFILMFLMFSLSGCADFASIFKKGSPAKMGGKSKKEGVAPNRKGKKGKVLSGYFEWPLRATVSSKFGDRWGRKHDGIDISSPKGTEFKASASGEVFFAGNFSGYGNLILLRHPNKYVTAYAHCLKMKVKEGDKVEKGDVIGEVGNSGSTTGYNLHFEIRYETTPMDPLDFLP